MRYAISVAIVLALLAGCGGDDGGGEDAAQTTAAVPTTRAPTAPVGTSSPESVVRAWLEALNAGQNDEAARLFARNAKVTDEAGTRSLASQAGAEEFVAGIPCGMDATAVAAEADEATVTATLTERPGGECRDAGTEVRPRATVRNGKIVALDLGAEPGR